MANYFKGVIPEPMISYHPDGNVDCETTKKIFKHLADSGATALFINGFGDECYSLSLQERIDIIKLGLEATAGTDCEPVGVVMVTCLRDALWLIKEYEKAGVKALSLTPPPFYALTDDAMYQYLGDQLRSTSLPTMIYNCREMDDLLSPEILGVLAHEFPHLCGYKDATRDPIHLTYCMDALSDIKDFCFLSGCDATFFMHLSVGATGTVSFMSIPFFDQMKAIYDHYQAGEYEKSWQAQQLVLKLRTFMKRYPDSAAYIYAMKYTAGIDVRGTRHPEGMLYIPEEEKLEFDALVKELGIACKS
jgi:4-hydroxy-tetrahydrodipicolinate synthase